MGPYFTARVRDATESVRVAQAHHAREVRAWIASRNRLRDWMGFARAAIEAAVEVHRQLEPGFLEGIYEEALTVELTAREIPWERQKPLLVRHKGRAVGEGRMDLLAAKELLVELKAVEALAVLRSAD